jgi:DNA-binding IclR family transcriptional regulator
MRKVKHVQSTADSRQGVQSVEMTLKVLLAVADGSGSRALKDISAAAGLAPSSAHRHLITLVRTGMVEQNSETGRYDLGTRVMELGLKALSRRDPIRLAGESLEELRDALGHTVFLAIWANHGPTIVRWEEGTQAVTVNVRVGSVLPLMRSATGGVFLCWLPSSLTDPILQIEKARAKDVERLKQATRARGLGSVEGDLLPGVASLSAPVFDHRGKIVAAITTLGAQDGFDINIAGKIEKQLKKTANKLCRRLCGLTPPNKQPPSTETIRARS